MGKRCVHSLLATRYSLNRHNSLAGLESNSSEVERRLVRKVCLLPVAGVFAWFAVVAPAAVPAQLRAPSAKVLPSGLASGSFEIAEHGHAVGTASFRFTKTQGGFESTSLVKVQMQGLDYALSKNEQLTAANQLTHVQLSATVNGEAVSVVAKPDAAQFLMNISARGKSSTTRMATHKYAVFMPDFDPGALETLLALAGAQNSRDLWVILPKNAGSIEPVRMATYPDQHGTLNGKPITVHHLVATIAGANTDLFSGPENQLLQAELPQQGFALVRKGFVLEPPAKPEAPRAE
jgi:hypothetical protein